MLTTFKNHINTQLPFLTKGKLLIAISGGLDSVVLTHLCSAHGLDIALAHCNFNLRGEESDADEAFVIDLAEQLGVEVFVQHFNTEAYAQQEKLSIQMAARELRYQWFNDLAEQLHFDYILTAHHADDAIETMLINLTRGTGIEGLIGIPEINGKIVRPMLSFSRAQILDFAKQKNLDWREDSSNTSTKYMRNKIRHKVVPVFKELHPEFLQNVLKTQSHLRDVNDDLQDRIEKFKHKVLVEIELVKYLKIKKINKHNRFYLYLFFTLKPYGFTQWNDIYNLLDAQSGKFVKSSTHRLLKDREFLILSPLSEVENDDEILISEEEKTVQIHSKKMTIETVKTISKTQKNTAYFDKHLLKFPLVVRRWKKGDYFYPFGMSGKKKLSKFFKDEKLSLLDKENVLVMCSGDEIIWILNYRTDNRFKISEQTEQIIKITIN